MLTPQVIVPAVLVPLIGYRLYRRFRGNFGRQPIQPQRLMARLAILSLVVAIFASTAIHSAAALEAIAGGLIAGAAIAVVGLRLTQFASDEKGSYYTPNSYIGAAVTLLLVGRITYRMIVMFTMPQAVAQSAAGGNPYAAISQSPLTLALLMLTLGYYLTYSAGVLIKSRALVRPGAGSSHPSNPA